MSENNKEIIEEEITATRGGIGLLLNIIITLLGLAGIVVGVMCIDADQVTIGSTAVVIGLLANCFTFIFWFGFHIINPNEALVLTLFGNYYGTIKKPGFYFTNPFCGAINPSAKTTTSQSNGATTISVGQKKISTKIMTLNNEKQKVNDILGNPIIIGAVVVWKVVDPTKAVFMVEDYKRYLSIQCDSTIRNISRLYPYDIVSDEGTDEKTLRGSSQEIADSMTDELQRRVSDAGLKIQEVRITHLSYAEEIAAAMLQRQQATAIIAARKKIVEGAVSMVKMAIDQLNQEDVIVLDDERKAAMVSNLLVVLCGNKDAQPIVNSGSIY